MIHIHIVTTEINVNRSKRTRNHANVHVDVALSLYSGFKTRNLSTISFHEFPSSPHELMLDFQHAFAFKRVNDPSVPL